MHIILFCLFTESQFVILQGTVFVSHDSMLMPLLKANTSQNFPLCFSHFFGTVSAVFGVSKLSGEP